MGEYVLHLAAEENITLSPAVVNRLLDGDNGDAALLYLCLLKNRGSGTSERMCAQLRWDALRLRRAEEALAAMGLVGAPKACAEEVPAAPLTPEQRPNYSREDVMTKLEKDATFASLLREVERKLGSLSEPSVRKLLGLYEHAGLTADVIFLLVNYCIERASEQFGTLPTMRQIEQEGYAWARRELFSTAAATAYLQREKEKRAHFGDYMAALGFGSRRPTASEEKYLARWAEMGFPAETLAAAFDKTVFRCGEFKWAYCNGILKKWHEKGIHTAAEAAAEGSKSEKKKPDDRNAWMEKYL